MNARVWITNCLFGENVVTGGVGAHSVFGDTGGGGNALGAAIYARNTTLNLWVATLTNNLAKGGERESGGKPLLGGGSAFGGAIALEECITVVSNCVFLANQARPSIRIASDSLSV
ncbi:MAG: hypothetical protein U1G07_27600, partial [Verrucomicrobiota bacterium]